MKLTRTFQMIQIKDLLPCQLVRLFNLFYDHQDFRRKFSNKVGVSINFKKVFLAVPGPVKVINFSKFWFLTNQEKD